MRRKPLSTAPTRLSTANSPAEPALSTSSRQVAHRLSTGARRLRSPAPPDVEWEKQSEAHQAAHESDPAKPPTKVHPRTTRKNIGEGYHGCLRITARRSSDLYRKIEGWAAAAMIGPVLSTRSA